MGKSVEIYEVGPRDGLQNEAGIIPAADKIAFVDALSKVGFARIEVASFVSPRRVPQMADGAEVMDGIRRAPGVRYVALVPNMRGLERALAARADEVAVFGSASEGFSQANLGCSIAQSLDRFAPVVAAALSEGIAVRGYVSCVTDCPYDGPVEPAAVARMTEALLGLGCAEVSLGDTIGRAVPNRVTAMLSAVLTVASAGRLAGHFHDTGGRALDNIDAALEAGLRVVDASAGGLGGCPFAPGASGNVATEAVAAHLAARGYDTGLKSEALSPAAGMARALRERSKV